MLVQGGIVQLIDTASGEHYSIQPFQSILIQAKGFANLTLDPVALDRAAYVLLGNDQAKTWVRAVIGSSQDQQFPAGDLEIGPVEYPLVVGRGQQPEGTVESIANHRGDTARTA